MTAPDGVEASLRSAIGRRASLIERLAAEQTDCYRLLHGTQEGAPGVTLDRYGGLALLQSFHAPVTDVALAGVGRVLDEVCPGLDLVYNDRSAAGSRVLNRPAHASGGAAASERVVTEHGVRFHLRARHRGHDPWLFLDLRTTRRAIMDEAAGKSLLNLFAYTCGAGVAAAVAGARRVLNVDFTTSSLAVGTANAVLNGVAARTTELTSDVFPALAIGRYRPATRRARATAPAVSTPRTGALRSGAARPAPVGPKSVRRRRPAQGLPEPAQAGAWRRRGPRHPVLHQQRGTCGRTGVARAAAPLRRQARSTDPVSRRATAGRGLSERRRPTSAEGGSADAVRILVKRGEAPHQRPGSGRRNSDCCSFPNQSAAPSHAMLSVCCASSGSRAILRIGVRGHGVAPVSPNR